MVQLLQGCAGNTILATQVTDSNGFYTFYNLSPGQYRVRFSNLPTGYQFTASNVGTADNLDSDANADGITDCLSLVLSENNSITDAGMIPALNPTATPTPQPGLNAITGLIWYDLDANGANLNDEPPSAGTRIQLLLGCSGESVLNSQTTEGDGRYNFSALASGQYRIRVIQDIDFTLSPKDASADANDSDIDPVTGLSDCLTLSNGSLQQIDAGVIPPL